MENFLLQLLGASWRTTLIGALGAIAILLVEQWSLPGGINWATFIHAAIPLLLGRVAKDGQVTGGSIPQTKEAEKRSDSKALTEENAR